MGVAEILASIDHEIALLQQARTLLAGATGVAAVAPKKKVGRPKKDAAPVAKKAGKTKKRNLTPEGRRRIAEAVKRRWEAQKKAASGK
jgi:hypothetical protein